MLLVPVRLAPSPIHGLSAFAVQPIARDTAVWRFTPGFDLDLDPGELERQPEHFRKALLHYGWLDYAARDIAAGEELTIDYGIVEGRRS